MPKYKCPKCGMEYDAPGKCEMCDVELEEVLKKYPYKKIKILNYADEINMASNLFRDFRECDKKGYDIILVRAVREKDFGCAIMNRLRKASCKKN